MRSAMLEGGTDHLKLGEAGPVTALLSAQPQLRAFIATLDHAALAELEGNLQWYGVPAGTELFQQGDIASDVFLVTAGRLGVLVDRGLGPQLVEQVRPGELTGEMALISKEPRSATVVALRNSELVSVPIQVAEQLVSRSPQLMQYMLRQLTSRLRE